jgi:maltose-binding protein MalE
VFVDAHDRVASYVEEHLVRGYGPLEPEQAADFDTTQLESLVYGSDLWGVPLSAKSLVLYVNLDLAAARSLETLEDFEALRDEPAMRAATTAARLAGGGALPRLNLVVEEQQAGKGAPTDGA